MFSGPRNRVVSVYGPKVVGDGVTRQLLRMGNCGDPAFLWRRLRIPRPRCWKEGRFDSSARDHMNCLVCPNTVSCYNCYLILHKDPIPFNYFMGKPRLWDF